MPFEGDRHRCTWASWPFGEEEWRGQLPAARVEYAAMIGALCRFEPVQLLCANQEAEDDARSRLPAGADVTMHRIELDDVWFRDNGPTFVSGPSGVAPICWTFNGWAGKYDHEQDALAARELCRREGWSFFERPLVLEGGALEPNGEGVLLTTRSCLLHPRRNPGMSEADYCRLFEQDLGIERVIWLESGLEGDHTDGHIDTLTRFTGPNQVLTSVCARSDSNFATLDRNRRDLLAAGLEVVELPIPSRARLFLGQRLPETYANFYLANGAVLLPIYGDPHDAVAVEILSTAFPEHQILALESAAIITSGGSFHCLTQQQPEGPPWKSP